MIERHWPAPVFETVRGKRGAGVEALLDASGLRISRRKLGLYLSAPALEAGFRPDTPWAGVRLIRPPARLPLRSDKRYLPQQFAAAVEKLIGDARTVGVLFSGGLDSGAVLTHAAQQCAADGRRLVAVLLDTPDDTGTSPRQVASAIASACAPDCVLETVDPNGIPDAGEPADRWDPAGPKGGTSFMSAARAGDIARRYGAHVMLTGHGADDYLCTPRFVAGALASRSPRAAVRYLRDIHARAGRSAISAESLALGASVLPHRHSAELYWSIAWPGACNLEPPSILAEDLRDSVRSWAREWVQTRLQSRTEPAAWWRRDLLDGFFPYDVDLGPKGIRHASPYLEPTFVRYGLGLPPSARFDPALPSPYQRRKSAIVNLFPRPARRVLPLQKQYYSRAVSEIVGDRSSSGDLMACRNAGLISRTPNASDPPNVVASLHRIERWLAHAIAEGATIGE